MAVTPDRINLTIDEIVLTNMSIRDSAQFKSAIETQLGHLLSQKGLSGSVLKNGVSQESVNANMKITASSQPNRMAGHIAEAIYGSLSK